MSYDPKDDLYDGHTDAELQSAFEKVQNPDDWRAPINTTILEHELAVVTSAVMYFTSTEVEVVSKDSHDVTITAVGYRNGPAGP